MFFKEFIEQHRVHLLISHAVGFSFFVAHHQVSIYFLNIFGHEAKLLHACWIYLFLVMKGNRLKRKERFTDPLHWLDIIFETARGSQRSQLMV